MSSKQPGVLQALLLGEQEPAVAREWLLLFAILIVLTLPDLGSRPNWDAAMSIFPAAAALESLDFDMAALLAMPGYHEGGPNTHATSLATLVMALLLRLLGDGTPFFLTLHGLHLAFCAWGLLHLRRLAMPLIGAPMAYLILLPLLLHPVFRVQLGALYIDLPAAMALIVAIYHASRRAPGRAALWLTVACAVKPTALFAGGVLALLYLAPGSHHPLQAGAGKRELLARLGKTVALLTPALSLTYLAVAVGPWGKEVAPFSPAMLYLNSIERYLLNAPDLLAGLLIGLGWSGWQLYRLLLRGELRGTSEDGARLAVAALILCYVLFFYVFAPLLVGYYQVLIRYAVLVLPFLLLALFHLLARWLSLPWRIGVLALLLALELANQHGRLYPPFVPRWGNDYSIAERSFESRALAALQRAGTAEIEGLGQHHPVIHAFPDQLLMSHPLMGYAGQYPPLAISIVEFVRRSDANAMLDSRCVFFYLLYPWGGTAEMNAILQRLQRGGRHEIQLYRTLRNGPFRAQIVLARPSGVECVVATGEDGQSAPESPP